MTERLAEYRLKYLYEFYSDKQDHHAAVLLNEIKALTEERDLARAHDVQTYPTAEAYESVCNLLAQEKLKCESYSKQQVSREEEIKRLKHVVTDYVSLERSIRNATWDDCVDGNVIVGQHSWKRIQDALVILERKPCTPSDPNSSP
jgi:hypothetical protein